MYLNFKTTANTVQPGANVLLIANGTVGLPGQFLSTGFHTGDNDYWVTLPIPDVSKLTANNTLFVGDTSAANVVSNAQLQANLTTITSSLSSLSTYQTVAGLAANVVTMTANDTLYVGTVSAANVVSNAQLQANLLSLTYVTPTQLAANLANFNVATLTSNDTLYVGTIPAADVVSTTLLQTNLNTLTTEINTTLNGYQTQAGLAANVTTMTANDTLFVGTIPAKPYRGLTLKGVAECS